MWEERKKEFNLRASAIVAFEDVELWGVAGKMRALSSTSVVRSGFPGIRKTNDWSGGQEGRGGSTKAKAVTTEGRKNRSGRKAVVVI